jgi:Kef-type K+ transport system membrane component KefB
MDFSTLTQYFVLVVVVACLVVGYIIKKATFFKWISNDDIPAILACVGCVLNLFVSGFSIDSAVWGALMGLTSTGLHQAFKRFVEGTKTEEEKTE